jgi:hypothetical protein
MSDSQERKEQLEELRIELKEIEEAEIKQKVEAQEEKEIAKIKEKIRQKKLKNVVWYQLWQSLKKLFGM